MVTDKREPDKEVEFDLVKKLHQKGYTRPDIAVCLQRGRKIYKWEPTDIDSCMNEVQDIILQICRRVN